MIKKFINLILQALKKNNYILYLGSTDILPPPLEKEEEIKYIKLSQEGDL